MFYVIFSVVYSTTLSPVPVSPYSPLPQILSIPPHSSHPHLEWCICMEITGPHYLRQFSRCISIFFYLFIYLEPLPPSTEFWNVREREERELCYLGGIVISWAVPLWLEPAPAEPTAEWTISCSPLEGKSWFLFPSLTAQPPKPIVLSLPIYLSISFTSYLFHFWAAFRFHFLYLHLSYFYFCLSLHNFDLLWTSIPNFPFHNNMLLTV